MSRPESESAASRPIEEGKAHSSEAKLAHLRSEIDAVDSQLVELLAQRHRLVQKVIEVKQQGDLPTSHPAREENLISARRDQAVRAGLDPDYVEDLFRTMLRHSRIGQ